ncbi:hypothetical protein OEZ86_006671 [Tetradesmus obliquus]|nr:hypothetical protein OEZ86_006671 [Tetradesmus obliquus]
MSHWLLPKRGVETNADAVKLFCFPQAGMGAAVFHAWSERLAPHVQVLPVELPGHASRMREPCTTNMCQLSCQIVDALASSFASGPYALFGHSMGAWLAWEVLQELARRQLPLPLRLYVSGNRAAALHGAEHDLDATRLHTLEADAFWQAFERRYGANPQLSEPKIKAFVYPVLKDDFTLVETYKPSTPDVMTSVPITAIGARLDNRYTAPQVSAWQQHTTAALQEVWLEGLGHNYIADAPDSLLQSIASQLSCA